MYKLLADANTQLNLQGLGANQSNFGVLTNLNITQIISGLIGLILVVTGVVFFFILVIGGIRWIASGGDKGQTEAARSQITAALVGLVIVFAAWAIVKLIESFFGVSILTPNLPKITQ